MFFFFWHYNPWRILSLFHNCHPCSRSRDLRIYFLLLARHCSGWVVSVVSIWFQASQGSQDTYFLQGGVVSLTPNPQLTWRTRVSHVVCVITLTCLSWEALPVAMLLPAWLSGSFDHASCTTTSKYGYLWWGGY